MNKSRLFHPNSGDAAIAALLAVLFGGLAGATRLLNPSVLPADWEPEILIQAAPLFLGAASCVFALWATIAGRAWLEDRGNDAWTVVVSLFAGLAVAMGLAACLGAVSYPFREWFKNGPWLLVLLVPVVLYYRRDLRKRHGYGRTELKPWLWGWSIATVCALVGRGPVGMALVGVGLAAALGFSLSWSAAVCRALGYRHGWQGTLLTLLMLLSPLALILATAAGVLACAGSPSGAPWGYAHWLALGAIPLIALVLSFRAWRAAGRVLREKREAA